jgi:leucyl aminopeptidase
VPITFTHARSVPKGADVVVVGVPADGVADSGLDADVLAARGFEGKVGQAEVLTGANGAVTVAVGLGPADEIGPAVLRRAGAAAARAAARRTTAALTVLDQLPDDADRPACARALVEGVALASYRFRAFKAEPAPAELRRVSVVSPGGRAVTDAVALGAATGEAVAFTRDLVNRPGGDLTPTEAAKAARSWGRTHGLKVSVMDERAIREARLGGVLGVNRGSSQPPKFVTVTYTPSGTPTAKVALVGKGITFDSGGLSIKTSDGMSTMKCDMGGAGAVLGAMGVIAAEAPPVQVTAYLPFTDNMTGPDATRPGDVLRHRDGTTTEVLNTDAEGRLILADALALASESSPDAIVDAATLTGACMVALGRKVAGLMGNDDDLVERVRAAAEATGESVWHLPLPAEYRPLLDSTVADLRNIGKQPHGGALTAGLFLQEFVGEGIPWAHLDIAGPAWSDADEGLVTAGGTGFGVRLLAEVVAGFGR